MKAVIWREVDGGCLVARLPSQTALRRHSAAGLMPIGKYRGVSIAQVVEHDPDKRMPR